MPGLSIKKIACLAASLLLALWSGAALAWGREGHRVIAQIAEQELTPVARAHVHALLLTEGSSHLADIASWADQVKRQTTDRPSHTLRLSLTGSPRSDACPSGYCLIAGLERYISMLQDSSQSTPARLEALKYVVHLTGDAHEPLHTVEKTGSHIQVVFDGETTTLHKVWDTDILKKEGGDPTTLPRRLLMRSAGLSRDGSPLDWAEEGRDIARDQIYSSIPMVTAETITLAPDYARRNWPTVARRLTQAGLRLAIVLNRAFA